MKVNEVTSPGLVAGMEATYACNGFGRRKRSLTGEAPMKEVVMAISSLSDGWRSGQSRSGAAPAVTAARARGHIGA